METARAKVFYDSVDDILYIKRDKSGESIKMSISIGDMVLDVSHNLKVLGIEVLNASKQYKLSKKILKEAKNADLRNIMKPNFFGAIYVIFLPKSTSIRERIAIPAEIS